MNSNSLATTLPRDNREVTIQLVDNGETVIMFLMDITQQCIMARHYQKQNSLPN
jgi:GTP1/Obg family GTP-binding protein